MRPRIRYLAALQAVVGVVVVFMVPLASGVGNTRPPVVCPCLDLWDGPPYPSGVTGSGPYEQIIIPLDLTGTQCGFMTHYFPNEAIRSFEIEGQPMTFTAATSEEVDMCSILDLNTGAHAYFFAPSRSLFNDGSKNNDGSISMPTMEACRTLFEDRGCIIE